jgi:phosphoglycolate phosphatase
MTRPIVYDLDGTLVDLQVDWDAARQAVSAEFATIGLAVDGCDLWDLLDLAEAEGHVETFEDIVGPRECDGARASTRLPLADELLVHEGAVGVCSLNCEAACREALSVHELSHGVDAVVGRDSVATRKPDPEPLLATLSAMGVDREEAVFVGDSARDEEAAQRAGVEFRWVDGVADGD